MKTVRCGLIVMAAMASAATARAQSVPPLGGVSIGVGYQLLHIPDETFPFGMNFDVAAPITRMMHVVGEFGFATDDQTEPGVSGNLTMYNLGAGARWTMSNVISAPSVIPFAQLVVGVLRTDADLTQNGVPFHAADWAFMLQPGAGVTVPISPMIGVIGQVDYRRAFFSKSENEFRVMVGVRLGR